MPVISHNPKPVIRRHIGILAQTYRLGFEFPAVSTHIRYRISKILRFFAHYAPAERIQHRCVAVLVLEILVIVEAVYKKYVIMRDSSRLQTH